MKRKWLILVGFFVLLALFIAIYPHIEIQTEDKFIAFRYSDDFSEFEDEISVSENYTYYEDRDISITGFDFKKFLCFHVLIMDYEKGNLCLTEFVMEDGYIEDFLANAVIEENPAHIDLKALLEGKERVSSHARYVPEDYETCPTIYYTLHDEYNVMFVYEQEGLLIVQVGYPDEGPKYAVYQ